MNILRVLILCTAGVLLAAGCSLNPTGVETGGAEAVNPADAPSAPAPVESRGLALTAQPEKERYVVGEPVYVRVLLTNRAREALTVPEYLSPENGSLEIRIQGPGGKSRLYKPMAVLDDAGRRKLAAGETLGNVVPVFFGARGWSFPEAGDYRLSLRFIRVDSQGRREWVESAPVSLRIEKPEAAALTLEGDAGFQAGKFLLWQSGDHLSQGRELLMGHARQYPDAVVSDYINAAFARSLSDSFMDYRREQVRPADCDKAMAFLERVDEARVGDYIRVQNAITGLRCAARADDAERRKRYRERVQRLTEGQPAYRPLVQRAEELAGVQQ